MTARTRNSCTELFKILPFNISVPISFSPDCIDNRSLFMENSQLYNIKTRNNSTLFCPLTYSMIYQKDPLFWHQGV